MNERKVNEMKVEVKNLSNVDNPTDTNGGEEFKASQWIKKKPMPRWR
jgi:hypothetical protein